MFTLVSVVDMRGRGGAVLLLQAGVLSWGEESCWLLEVGGAAIFSHCSLSASPSPTPPPPPPSYYYTG